MRTSFRIYQTTKHWQSVGILCLLFSGGGDFGGGATGGWELPTTPAPSAAVLDAIPSTFDAILVASSDAGAAGLDAVVSVGSSVVDVACSVADVAGDVASCVADVASSAFD